MEERRKHPRTETDDEGYIWGDGSSTSCRLLNVSVEGAAIEVPNAALIPDRFKLMTTRDRATSNCRIVWKTKTRIGIAFE